MRKVVLYIATSLDNYIAKPDGNVDWLDSPEFIVPGEDFGYETFYKSIDTTLMGNNTYQMVLGFDVPFPYPDKKNFVFTRNKGMKDNEHVSFISDDIVAFTKQLKQEKGKDIWLVGGGEINTKLLDHGLIDRIILTLIPKMLGMGIPLFHKPTIETNFHLEECQSYDNGFVQLTYTSN